MPLAKKAAAEEKIAKNVFRFAKIKPLSASPAHILYAAAVFPPDGGKNKVFVIVKTCPPASDFKQY